MNCSDITLINEKQTLSNFSNGPFDAWLPTEYNQQIIQSPSIEQEQKPTSQSVSLIENEQEIQTIPEKDAEPTCDQDPVQSNEIANRRYDGIEAYESLTQMNQDYNKEFLKFKNNFLIKHAKSLLKRLQDLKSSNESLKNKLDHFSNLESENQKLTDKNAKLTEEKAKLVSENLQLKEEVNILIQFNEVMYD